jgi:uncharacterized protein (TIGR04255 family)
MKFPKCDRTLFKKNILFEVIFQARFPEILRISNEEPVAFQDKIRKNDFPETKIKKSDLPAGIPDAVRKALGGEEEYSFFSDEHDYKVVLTKQFIALSCKKYTDYVNFEKRLQSVLDIFFEIYEPSYFRRIGLRYRNLANKTVLEKEIKNVRDFIPDHIAPEIKGEVGEEVAGFEKTILFSDNFCNTNVRYYLNEFSGKFGKFNINDEKSYIIDIDCFTEEKIWKVQDAINTSKKFNEEYIRNVFQWSSTDELRVAMEPIP